MIVVELLSQAAAAASLQAAAAGPTLHAWPRLAFASSLVSRNHSSVGGLHFLLHPSVGGDVVDAAVVGGVAAGGTRVGVYDLLPDGVLLQQL